MPGPIAALLLPFTMLSVTPGAVGQSRPDNSSIRATTAECIVGRSGMSEWQEPPLPGSTASEELHCVGSLLVYTKPRVPVADPRSPTGAVLTVPVDCVTEPFGWGKPLPGSTLTNELLCLDGRLVRHPVKPQGSR